MKILVITPTYNESKNITKLINGINSLEISLDLLIIDDNSPDNTADIIKGMMKKYPNIILMERSKKLGLGTAYVEGFKYAIKNNYTHIIQIDADMSHDPNDIIKLLKNTNKNDLVIGSRYVKGVNVINWPIGRLLLSYIANLYARFLISIPIYDLTGGFKCFKKNVLLSLDLDKIKSEGYSFQIEINFLTYYNGFSIKEIPIIFTDRTVGESKMNKKIILEAVFLIPKLFFRRIVNKF